VFTYRAVKAGQAKVQMKYVPTGEAFAVTVEVVARKAEFGAASATRPAAADRSDVGTHGRVFLRILSGSDRDEQPDHPLGKPEPWIVEEMKRMGAPTVKASTGWIEVGEKEAEVYRTMQGGRLIKAQATRQSDGKVVVRLDGYKIGQVPRQVELDPKVRSRDVIKLTDYPGGNVFAAIRLGEETTADPKDAPGAEAKPADSRESTPGE
jgi:hypothetical protein